MDIKFDDFGRAASGEVHLNDLTIICGPNGSGKTYISYAIYGILKNFVEYIDYGFTDDDVKTLIDKRSFTFSLDHIKKNIKGSLRKAGINFAASLDSYFNAPDDFFNSARFAFEFTEEEMDLVTGFNGRVDIAKVGHFQIEYLESTQEVSIVLVADGKVRIPRQLVADILTRITTTGLFGPSIPVPFVVTSERTGVSLFYKELDINRNGIVQHMSSVAEVDILGIFKAMKSKYAQPIQDNIDTVRDYSNLIKKKSYLRSDKASYSYIFDGIRDLIGGSFKDDNNQIVYYPKVKRNFPKISVPIYIASSSIKSLFLIDLYINHLAEKNSILIIDEPELNLHPDNQVKMARLVARLVNSGIKVLVTTHSDYFMREVNNLITLSRLGKSLAKIQKKYKYVNQDVLRPDQISAYCATIDEGLNEMNVSSSGIDTQIFDHIINDENYKAQEIYDEVDE